MINSVTNNNSTTGTNGSSGSTSSSSALTSNSAMGKDDFMKLMIAQLQNQDPLNPADGTEFAAQLAQFSSLEQLQNLNTSMTNSVNANYTLAQSINNTMSATLIGNEVKVSGNSFGYTGQESINLGYNIPKTAASVTIKIYDSSGKLVNTIKASDVDAGDQKVAWDFKNSIGNTVAQGKYTYTVDATSNSGDTLTTTKFVYGTITGVRYTEDGTKLLVDGTEYALADILEVLKTGQSGGN
jgi:Flagellar hook capping protein